MGLKFPSDISKPETLEKKYAGKLSRKALSLMQGLLRMDPLQRLTGEQALMHEYFDDIRDPNDNMQIGENEMSALIAPV